METVIWDKRLRWIFFSSRDLAVGSCYTSAVLQCDLKLLSGFTNFQFLCNGGEIISTVTHGESVYLGDHFRGSVECRGTQILGLGCSWGTFGSQLHRSQSDWQPIPQLLVEVKVFNLLSERHSQPFWGACRAGTASKCDTERYPAGCKCPKASPKSRPAGNKCACFFSEKAYLHLTALQIVWKGVELIPDRLWKLGL